MGGRWTIFSVVHQGAFLGFGPILWLATVPVGPFFIRVFFKLGFQELMAIRGVLIVLSLDDGGGDEDDEIFLVP